MGADGSRGQSDVYQQMLAEAGVNTPRPASPERLPKRRRTAPKPQKKPGSTMDSQGHLEQSETEENERRQGQEDEDDGQAEEVEFQDVILPNPTAQTLERDSDDDSDEDQELQFEDVDFMNWLNDTKAPETAELELNLTAHQLSTTPSKRAGERRKPITKEEKDRRISIHKAHLLCLLSHVARRNHWCNDLKVQESLRPHLTEKTVDYLNPGSHLPQFGQAESLKNGLKRASDVWRTKFEIRERGLRRALWAEDVEQLKDVGITRRARVSTMVANALSV